MSEYREEDLVRDAVPLSPIPESADEVSNESSRLAVFNSSLTTTTTLADENSCQLSSRSENVSSDICEEESNSRDTNSTFPYNVMETEEDEISWLSANRFLGLEFDGLPNEHLWKKLGTILYKKIEAWEKEALARFTPPVWDFCVIHSKDELDQEIVDTFLNFLELEGLIGVSVCNFRVDDEKFEASRRILNGSTVVFALDSPTFAQSGFHQYQYQESMVKKLRDPEWRKKLIPLRLSRSDATKYRNKYPHLLRSKDGQGSLFGLASTEGITMTNRAHIIEKVRQVLTPDQQEINEEMRRRHRDLNRYKVYLAKQTKCRQLKKSLHELRRHFESGNLTQESLIQLCIECNELPSCSSMEEGNQVITLEDCTQIQIGPSFHFNVYRADTDLSSSTN